MIRRHDALHTPVVGQVRVATTPLLAQAVPRLYWPDSVKEAARPEVMGMLALTRRVGEEVVIGDPKEPLGMIRVVDIHGDKVRLAFEFPRELQINRRELADVKARGEPPANAASKSQQKPGPADTPNDNDKDNDNGKAHPG